MAIITRGKHKGKEVKLHQFCNDWMMVEHYEIPNQETIFKPTALYFSDEEKSEIQQAERRGQTGFMFQKFYWDGNILKKKNR